MNVSNFLQQSAKFMSADRPDIWSVDTAFKTVTEWFSLLAGDDEGGEISSGGFAMTKRITDGVYEYELHRKVIQFTVFDDEGTSIFDWTRGGTLVDVGLNIVDEEDDYDE